MRHMRRICPTPGERFDTITLVADYTQARRRGLSQSYRSWSGVAAFQCAADRVSATCLYSMPKGGTSMIGPRDSIAGVAVKTRLH